MRVGTVDASGNSGPDRAYGTFRFRMGIIATKFTKFCGHVVGTRFWPHRPCMPEITSDLPFSSGRDRRRSGDLTLFRRALYLLSYPTG
jgi:hypothetical protein